MQTLSIATETAYEVDPIFGFEWSETAKDAMTWHNGMIYPKLLGKDWRIPTKFELSMMFDTEKNIPIIDGFTASSYYWSSTIYAPLTDYAWGTYFGNGYDSACLKSDSYYVRCVRGKQKFDNLAQYEEWLLKQSKLPHIK
jgi:hypothetical protein